MTDGTSLNPGDADRREITPVQRERHKHSPLAALSLLTAAARIDPTLREAVATVERAVGAALVVAWEFGSYDRRDGQAAHGHRLRRLEVRTDG